MRNNQVCGKHCNNGRFHEHRVRIGKGRDIRRCDNTRIARNKWFASFRPAPGAYLRFGQGRGHHNHIGGLDLFWTLGGEPFDDYGSVSHHYHRPSALRPATTTLRQERRDVPAFPYQLMAAAAFTALLAISYMVVRTGRFPRFALGGKGRVRLTPFSFQGQGHVNRPRLKVGSTARAAAASSFSPCGFRSPPRAWARTCERLPSTKTGDTVKPGRVEGMPWMDLCGAHNSRRGRGPSSLVSEEQFRSAPQGRDLTPPWRSNGTPSLPEGGHRQGGRRAFFYRGGPGAGQAAQLRGPWGTSRRDRHHMGEERLPPHPRLWAW